jgi:HK97 family phage portal protein
MPTAAELLEAIETEFPNTVQQRVRTYNLKDAYKTVSWVYACVNLIADSISGVEFFFSRPDSLGNIVTNANGASKQLDDMKEPVVYCFYPPRPGEVPTVAEMIKMQFLHLGLYGESFMYLEKKGKYPVQIDLINPMNIVPIISKDGTSIEKWRITQMLPGGNTTQKVVPVSDIVQWKYPNPYNKFRGMAPLTAARLAIEQDLNMATWNAGFFQNGIRNPIALMLKQTFNEPQRKEYMNRMKQNFMGFVKGQLPLLVEGGVDVRVLSNTMKDLDFVEGKELTREELCAVYNVPPAMAGIFRYANYSNTKEQRTMLYQNTLRPKMVYYRDVFQQAILDVYFPGVVADWEWNSTDAFREDIAVVTAAQNTTAQTANIYWNMGYTMGQIAYILKQPSLDPTTHTTAKPVDVEVPEPEVPKSVSLPTISHSKDHMVIYAERSFLKYHAQSVLTETLRPATQRLVMFINSYFDQAQRSLKRSTTTTLNAKFWADQWAIGIVPIIEQVFIAGVDSVYRDLKAPEREGELNAVLLGTLDAKLLQAKQLGNTLIDGLQKSLTGMKKKDLEKKLVELLPTVIDKIPVSAIVHRVYNLGRFETMKLLGVEEAAWCSGGLCDDGAHRSLLAVSVKVGNTFPTTDLTFPGESGGTACSCTLFPLTVRKPEKKVVITRGLTPGPQGG